MTPVTNPHAGLPITDDDETIAAALEDVSIPALMCSMVHLTGDPEWVRGELRPAGLFLNEYQGFMDEEAKAEARRRALHVILGYRDGGCLLPPPPSPEVLQEMMSYLACQAVDPDVVPMFVDDLHLDGVDSGAATWGADLPDAVKADAPVIANGAADASGGSAFPRPAAAEGGDAFGLLLAGYAPGKGLDVWPAGTAKKSALATAKAIKADLQEPKVAASSWPGRVWADASCLTGFLVIDRRACMKRVMSAVNVAT